MLHGILMTVSGYGGQHWDFMDFLEPHCLPHSPLAGLVPWDWGDWIRGEAPTFPFLPPCGDVKSQRSARELKKTPCDSVLPTRK